MANDHSNNFKDKEVARQQGQKGGQASHSGGNQKQGSFASMDDRTKELAKQGGQAAHRK